LHKKSIVNRIISTYANICNSKRGIFSDCYPEAVSKKVENICREEVLLLCRKHISESVAKDGIKQYQDGEKGWCISGANPRSVGTLDNI